MTEDDILTQEEITGLLTAITPQQAYWYEESHTTLENKVHELHKKGTDEKIKIWNEAIDEALKVVAKVLYE